MNKILKGYWHSQRKELLLVNCPSNSLRSICGQEKDCGIFLYSSRYEDVSLFSWRYLSPFYLRGNK